MPLRERRRGNGTARRTRGDRKSYLYLMDCPRWTTGMETSLVRRVRGGDGFKQLENGTSGWTTEKHEGGHAVQLVQGTPAPSMVTIDYATRKAEDVCVRVRVIRGRAAKEVFALEGWRITIAQGHMGTIVSAWSRPVEEVRLMGDLKVTIPPKSIRKGGRTEGMSAAIMITVRTEAESTDRMVARYTTTPRNPIPLAIGTKKKQQRLLFSAVVSRNNHTTPSSATRIPLQRRARRRRKSRSREVRKLSKHPRYTGGNRPP
jgi:hypothetical protein